MLQIDTHTWQHACHLCSYPCCNRQSSHPCHTLQSFPPSCPSPDLNVVVPPSLPLPLLLLLQFTNGTVHVKATYDKSYELIIMPLQAAVLLPFNDSELWLLPAARLLG